MKIISEKCGFKNQTIFTETFEIVEKTSPGENRCRGYRNWKNIKRINKKGGASYKLWSCYRRNRTYLLETVAFIIVQKYVFKEKSK